MRTLYADELLRRIDRRELERMAAILDENSRLLRECAGATVHTSRALADAEAFESVACALSRLLTS
jgi:hypothetical protein